MKDFLRVTDNGGKRWWMNPSSIAAFAIQPPSPAQFGQEASPGGMLVVFGNDRQIVLDEDSSARILAKLEAHR
jgi:hypothetical protein